MHIRKTVLSLIAPVIFCGCTAQGSFDPDRALAVGLQLGIGALQLGLLDEETVKQTSRQAANQYDQQHRVADPGSIYYKRLVNLTRGIKYVEKTSLNFKVYIAEDINAFAMADGTIRLYSGLMDAMPDDQVLAVIQHEVGHILLKHSYQGMKEQLMTNTAFRVLASAGGTIGDLTRSDLGQIAYKAAHAHFSQPYELESDAYAVRALKTMGKDPYSMLRAIRTLQQKLGSGGGFLSSHPSNETRVEHIITEISESNMPPAVK
ncbi:MAG: M48 family metalloprotease [Methylococcales bacterium]|jgi:putative metalloprotease|nr:M48 family metalloprotease [Methylococcales bacterium]MEE2766750.1 M48 family metalloprotease [Pseudomonadota bacterium]